MEYPVELRETVIKKVLTSNETQDSVAEEFGIGRSTLQKWLRDYRHAEGRPVTDREKRPQDWSAEERFAALLEISQLEEEERVSWCRRHGLHSHHLAQWKAAAMAGTTAHRASPVPGETRQLREENKRLKKELRRKEKALAETSARLVLEKKSAFDLGGARERLIRGEDRQQALELIAQACQSGCRKHLACEALGLSLRTVQRWENQGVEDQRQGSRAKPANALTASQPRPGYGTADLTGVSGFNATPDRPAIGQSGDLCGLRVHPVSVAQRS
jgi:transposase